MKIGKQIIVWLLLPVQLVMAQETVDLSDCQNWARQNHPMLKQKEIYKQLSDLELENISTNYLPKVNFNAQATYQSDVTNVDINLPNVEIPSVSKDQYKMYLDVRQNIWDGGISKASELLEKSKEQANQQDVEVQLYKLRQQVNQFFFTSFFIQESLEVINLKRETLEARRNMVESGVKHGMVLAADLDLILAELVRLEQQELELINKRETVHAALSILTGHQASEFENLKLNDQEIILVDEIKRPEISMFEKKGALLSVSSDMLSKQRNPKLFGFGQAGYGRPGFNMLQNEFKTYYLVGLGLSWNVFDWKKTNRGKQSIVLQQELVQTQQNQFEQAVQIESDRVLRKINHLEKILKRDQDLIELQQRITKSSASKLENGAITIADYLQDLNAEMNARITFETHKIQLDESKNNYQYILGN